MNKLQKFVKRLEDSGLTEEQLAEVVDALDEFTTELFREMDDAQQDKENTHVT